MSIDQADAGIFRRFARLESIVCCPRNRTPLTLIGKRELLRRLPEDEHTKVTPDTQGAFLSESSGRAYPIRSNIADFLEQDALLLGDPSSVPSADAAPAATVVKRSVKDWYDQFGWQRNEMGVYNDTAQFSNDASAEINGYRLYELLSHLSLVDRLSGGEFLLDAASGAIAHPEYLSYSWLYKHRVCVDMSLTALMEAEAKIGTAGFCCLADICHLPFRDNVFDGTVSAYTIQHIPQTEQARAVGELYRVLSPKRNMCLIVGRSNSWEHRMLLLILRVLRKAFFFRRQAETTDAGSGEVSKQPHTLYCFLPDIQWWRDRARDLGASFAIEGLRSLEKFEFEWIFENSRHAARRVRFWERSFPRLAARLSPCLLIDMRKDK